jgi:hypothetical protein
LTQTTSYGAGGGMGVVMFVRAWSSRASWTAPVHRAISSRCGRAPSGRATGRSEASTSTANRRLLQRVAHSLKATTPRRSAAKSCCRPLLSCNSQYGSATPPRGETFRQPRSLHFEGAGPYFFQELVGTRASKSDAFTVGPLGTSATTVPPSRRNITTGSQSPFLVFSM